jgi:hypothetical protein
MLDDDRDITWRVLREMIDSMPEERLDDIVEIMPPDPDGDSPNELHKVIGMGTVGHYVSSEDGVEQSTTRSSTDNKHHPERYVLLVMENWFDEDGNWAFEWDMESDTYTGVPTGNVYVDEEVTTTEWRRKRIDKDQDITKDD